MDARLEQIAALAFHSAPAAEANSAIAEVRGAAPGGEPLRVYELVFSPEATFESFVRDHLPKLVYHLESIGAHPPRAAGVVLCLFAGDRLHFVHADALLGTVCALLAIGPEELVRRFGTGERRSAVPAALAALPPPAAKG